MVLLLDRSIIQLYFLLTRMGIAVESGRASRIGLCLVLRILSNLLHL